MTVLTYSEAYTMGFYHVWKQIPRVLSQGCLKFQLAVMALGLEIEDELFRKNQILRRKVILI